MGLALEGLSHQVPISWGGISSTHLNGIFAAWCYFPHSAIESQDCACVDGLF